VPLGETGESEVPGAAGEMLVHDVPNHASSPITKGRTNQSFQVVDGFLNEAKTESMCRMQAARSVGWDNLRNQEGKQN